MSHHAASALTHTAWDCSYGSSADRLKAHNHSYFVDTASCSIVPLLTRRSRWRYLVAHFAHPSVMPPQRPRDGKSRATLCRQGTRLGKRQRAEAKEIERMRCHDRVALPTAPPRSSAGSSTDLPQRPAGPEPAGKQGASAEVGQSQHVGATATPCGRGRQTTPEVRGHMAAPVFCQPRGQSMPGAHCPPAAPALCQPGGLPYMAPYCPPMLPLQCIHPPAEEGPIGAAWAEPIPPAHEPVVARTGAEPLTNPMTGLGRLTRDQPNWRAPASTWASSAADMSASSRPLRSIRPKSSSSTPSSMDSEDAVADLAAQFQGETQRDQILHPAQEPRGSAKPMDQQCLPRCAVPLLHLDSHLTPTEDDARKTRWMMPQTGYLQSKHLHANKERWECHARLMVASQERHPRKR